ncbi:CBS domain-containing protein [Granulosicoccaceae sp. 1_MG-2023]|nr:CBS domain-containing protein [Granulosicoccaceae sp. 1_MG-2023]
MNKTTQTLRNTSLEHFHSIRRPAAGDALTVDDPASLLMTDFSRTEPLTLSRDMPIDEANAAMRERGVRSALVTDSAGRFAGLLALTDLNSHRVLALATSRGQTRDDLTAGDMMRPRYNLCGISLQTLEHSSIGDCLKTLQQTGRQHLLITDPAQNEICGIISASDIARALHCPVEIPLIADSFVQVVSALQS